MGHINFQKLQEMVWDGAVKGVKLDSLLTPTFCEACVQGKAHRKAFSKVSTTTYSKKLSQTFEDLHKSSPLEVTHSRTCLKTYTSENHTLLF